MDDFIVDRNTGASREPPITEERRFCSRLLNGSPYDFIDFTCGDPRPDSTSRSGACRCGDSSCLTH